MKIINSITQDVYEYTPFKIGENKGVCPSCSSGRKKHNAKCFSWNTEKDAGYCNHCEAKFHLFREKTPKKDYKIPEWKNITDLSTNSVKWFEGRKITQKTLNKMRIYTENGFIKFPYFFEGNLKNIKSRDNKKNFLLEPGAEKIFYNLDCVKEFNEIIIVEGEIDALSFIEVGIDNVISVPNGASSNCDYLDDYYELFECKKIIIAVDYDPKGLVLRNELIRRFGIENCSLIKFKDCKDANEYLIKYGSLELQDAYNNREELPIDGVIDLNKCYDDIYSLYLNGMQPGLKINRPLDSIITWETSRVCVWTGIPSHGKSESVDEVVVLLNHYHKLKAGIFSPENYPIKYHISKLISKISGLPFNTNKLNQQEFEQCFEYVRENFHFIYPEEDFTIESILAKAKYLVKKYGIKTLVLDPYNKFEHRLNPGENKTDYVSRFLDLLTTFAKKHDILIILVAHPTKIKKNKEGTKYEIPTLYDVADSAHFYNKPDFGIITYRDWDSGLTEFHVQKVKFKHLGDGGMVSMKYNYNNGRYENENSTVDQWDSNSLLNQIDNQLKNLPESTEFDFSQRECEF